MPRWAHLNHNAKVRAVRGMSRKGMELEAMADALGSTVDAITELARDEDIFIGDIWSAPESIRRSILARRTAEAASERLQEIARDEARA